MNGRAHPTNSPTAGKAYHGAWAVAVTLTALLCAAPSRVAIRARSPNATGWPSG